MSTSRNCCTRHAFEGCAGDGGASCARCPGAEIVVAAPPPMPLFERVLVVAIVAIAVLGGVVGHASLTREARAYQSARV